MARRVKPHRTVYRTAYAAPSATSYMEDTILGGGGCSALRVSVCRGRFSRKFCWELRGRVRGCEKSLSRTYKRSKL